MATSLPPVTRTPSRRPASIAGTSNIPPRNKPSSPSAIFKGATARAAVSPRPGPSPNGRRTPNTTTSSRSSPVPGEDSQGSRDVLLISLKRESEHKEELLVHLQEKETQIFEVLKENSSISAALHAAECRLSEFYAEQARVEEEIAAHMETNEKLRSQLRELEKDQREALRRYAEQTAGFEAERQALYDNEQHLKSRIQSLTASRKLQQEAIEQAKEELAEDFSTPPEDGCEMLFPLRRPPRIALKEDDTDAFDSPKVTALMFELSTLTTSYASLQTTVQTLQTELTELKCVNNALQEENESYSLLLMERALNGAGVDMLRRVGGQDATTTHMESFNTTGDRTFSEEIECISLRSSKKSNLNRVIEDDELAFDAQKRDIPDPFAGVENASAPLSNQRRRRTRHPLTSLSHPGKPIAESLADLPITGPGLDLAAELGRAENKDMLDGSAANLANVGQKFYDIPMAKETSGEVEALRQEIKSLKDANKALSLYASKIIDRIIMQEGFEHVLSVDYDNKTTGLRSPETAPKAKAKETPVRPIVPRIPGFFLSRSSSTKAPSRSMNKERLIEFPTAEKTQKLRTFNDTRPTTPSNVERRNRRSMSFDWRSFSMFGGNTSSTPEKEKNLRPLTLRSEAPLFTSARKLEYEEDDDDRKERERLNVTMKLMGINKPPEEAKIAPTSATIETVASRVPSSNRFSFFGITSKPAQNPAVEPSTPSAELTSDALERAEVENSLASLDARERIMSVEIARGNGSGFTELPMEGRLSLGDQWRSQRSRSASGKSHSNSVSTIWSAGRGEAE